MRRSPTKFLREVREEWRKIAWPSWKETWLSSVMVALLVAGLTLLIAIIDGLFSYLSAWLYGHL